MVEFFKSKKEFPSQKLAKGDSAHKFSLIMSFYDVKNCLSHRSRLDTRAIQRRFLGFLTNTGYYSYNEATSRLSTIVAKDR